MKRSLKIALRRLWLFWVLYKPLLIAFAIGVLVMLPLIYVFVDEVIL